MIAFCKGHDKAVEFLKVHGGREQAVEVRQGQPKKESNPDNVRNTFHSGGTGSEYLLRRLAKTAPDILDRYGLACCARHAATARASPAGISRPRGEVTVTLKVIRSGPVPM